MSRLDYILNATNALNRYYKFKTKTNFATAMYEMFKYPDSIGVVSKFDQKLKDRFGITQVTLISWFEGRNNLSITLMDKVIEFTKSIYKDW